MLPSKTLFTLNHKTAIIIVAAGTAYNIGIVAIVVGIQGMSGGD
jgi:hypothetical protein